MAGEDNKRLTWKFIDAAWNTGHYDEAREHLATDFVTPPSGRRRATSSWPASNRFGRLSGLAHDRGRHVGGRRLRHHPLDRTVAATTGGDGPGTGLLGQVISKVVASVTWSGAISW